MGHHLKTALLVLCSGLAALLLAEGLARSFFPLWGPEEGRVTRFWRHDPRYGWSHIPGTTGRFRRDGFDTSITINSRGFRGTEVPYERRAGWRRVTVLGDSFVWGFGVEEEETFVARLEALVPRLEAVNLGVSGYGTDQELLLYRDVGRRYRADVVLTVVTDNDLTSNVRTVESFVYGKPRFVLNGDALVLENQPVPEAGRLNLIAVDLLSRSYVTNRLHRLLEWGAISRARAEASDGDGRYPETAAEQITTHLLLQLDREVRADGARLVLALVGGIPKARGAAEFLRTHGIDVVVLEDHLHGADPASHLPDRFHWNAPGHAIVADGLAGRLEPMLPAVRDAAHLRGVLPDAR